MPFTDLSLTDARKLLNTLPLASTAETARRFLDGDHWQGGAQWIGPRPAAGDEGAAETMAEIARAFIAKNAVGEAVKRHTTGVVGKPVAWRFAVARPMQAGEESTPDEQARIAEAESALTAWWDALGIAGLLQRAVRHVLAQQRVSLRLFVPPGLLDEAGRLPAGDLAAQLRRIVLDIPEPAEAAGVVTDALTRQRAGLFAYTLDQQPYLEVSFVDGDETVLRIIGGAEAQETRLPLGGRLLLHDLTHETVFLGEPVLSQQRLLNLAYTMLGRNVVMGGFLERVLLNAQLPGRWEESPSGRRFIPEPLRFGAGSVNVLQGAELRDERTDELKGYATPGVVYRDPVPVATFAETRDIAYRAILEECQQLHAVMSGDATASGASRQQATGDFLASLGDTQSEIERAVRWLLETALHLAAHFAGTPGRYLDLRATAACTLYAGPITADDITQTVTLVEADLLSRETGMARAGVDDTDAEAGRIAAEREQRATVGQVALASFDSGE